MGNIIIKKSYWTFILLLNQFYNLRSSTMAVLHKEEKWLYVLRHNNPKHNVLKMRPPA